MVGGLPMIFLLTVPLWLGIVPNRQSRRNANRLIENARLDTNGGWLDSGIAGRSAASVEQRSRHRHCLAK